MLTQFLNNTCTITSKTLINDNWVEKKTITTIYSNIACHIYNNWWDVEDTNISVNTKNINWTVILEPNKTNVRVWQYIQITDPALWTLWNYEIKTIKMNRLINGTNDSIQLSCSSI